MQPFEDRQVYRQGGPWFVLAAAVLWGSTGTAQAFAPVGAQPVVVGAVRLVVGGSALLVWAVACGSLWRGTPCPILALLFAAASIAAYQLCFFAAVATTGVAIGTMVAIGSAPILAGALGFFFRSERPGWRWLGATILAIAGCSLLLTASRNISVDLWGIMLALGAGGSYAIYTVASKRILDVWPPDTTMAVVFCLGALFLAPVLFIADVSWLWQIRGLAVALHLGLIATACAYLLFARGLLDVPVAVAVTLSLAEPLTASILGVVVLGEQLTSAAFLGMGLLFSGLALLSVRRKKGSHLRESPSAEAV